MCGIFFDADCWRAYLGLFAERAPGYLISFADTLAQRAEIPPDLVRSALDRDPGRVVDMLTSARPLDLVVEDHVQDLRRAGVVRQVIHGIDRLLPDGTNVNTRMANVIAPHADTLEIWPGLDLSDVDRAVAELDRCYAEFGAKGASIVHWWSGRQPRDAGSHLVYARAAELGIPLWIHTGTSFASNHPMDYCTWSDIDHIAVHHPDLTIVAGHGGWPWLLDGMAVLQRHRNVFLDFSAHRPRYMARTGSGWEPMLLYGQSVVRDRILFGSCTWVQSVAIAELADEVRQLSLSDGTTEAWLGGNARRLLDARVDTGGGQLRTATAHVS